MRILLVDDHGLFVEGLRNLLQAGGYEVVGAASDGLEALLLARNMQPDLILMDIRMPVFDGLKATRLIKAELPEIQIVMLTTSADDADLFEALKSGASGYLLKNLKPNALFGYLEGLSRGEAPLSRELSARLLREYTRQAAELEELHHSTESPEPQVIRGPSETPQPAASANRLDYDAWLTPRQLQILEMIADGSSYKEVGASLHISENTVKYHMGEILKRLHARNREQVVAYALRSGLLKK
jgi:DNA-binding NarL/FixJ family response regulator